MLIVLEGLDGAGKSTQISLLSDFFVSRGKKVRFLHFPRFDAPVYGDLISRFLRGELGSVESVNPFLVALLFAEDRRDAKSMIDSWRESGEIVILDRYVYSNIAYQCAKINNLSLREELRNWILDTEFSVYQLPRPDFNLFLDVPLDFVKSRLGAKRTGDAREYLKGKKDIHEESMLFQQQVRQIYLNQCDSDASGLVRLDCSDESGSMLTSEAIHGKLVSIIENRL
jgi:dTMP kinase